MRTESERPSDIVYHNIRAGPNEFFIRVSTTAPSIPLPFLTTLRPFSKHLTRAFLVTPSDQLTLSFFLTHYTISLSPFLYLSLSSSPSTPVPVPVPVPVPLPFTLYNITFSHTRVSERLLNLVHMVFHDVNIDW